MKKNKTILGLLFTLPMIFVTSCNTARNANIHRPAANSCALTEDQRRTISNEIETIVRENVMNAKALSSDTHTRFRANEKGYVLAGEGKIIFQDYPTYYEQMKQAFKPTEKFIEFNIGSMYIYVLSKEAATCTAEFKSKFLHDTGDTLVHNGCWTMVFKKFDNGWKIIQENGTRQDKLLPVSKPQS